MERWIEKRTPGSFYEVAEHFHEETAGDSRRRETWRNITVVAALIVAGAAILFAWKEVREQKLIAVVTEIDQHGNQSINYELSGTPLEPDPARDRGMVAGYVKARRSWNHEEFKLNHLRVLKTSSKSVGAQYKRTLEGADSDRLTYGKEARVDVQVTNVTAWNEGRNMHVAYTRDVVPRSGRFQPQKTYHTATVAFSYQTRQVVVSADDLSWLWAGLMIESFVTTEDFQ